MKSEAYSRYVVLLSLRSVMVQLLTVVGVMVVLALSAGGSPRGGPAEFDQAATAIVDFTGKDAALCRRVSETVSSDVTGALDMAEVRRAAAEVGTLEAPLTPELARALADRLQARWLIVGSVRIEGRQLFIQAHIVDGRTGVSVPGSGASSIGNRDATRSLAHSLAGEIRRKLANPGRRPSTSSGRIPNRITTNPSSARPIPIPSRRRELPANCTGLVVDVRNLRLERDASPFIQDEDGVQIYPDPAHLPGDNWVVEHGMASYVFESGDAERSGARPLEIRAVRVSGPGPFNVVVSREDAARIRAANQQTGFLATWAVTFLTDRDKAMHLLGGKANLKYIQMYKARMKGKHLGR